MTDTDHQINALMQMLSEANGREMQLRSVLGKMQGEITRLEAEVERLKATRPEIAEAA